MCAYSMVLDHLGGKPWRDSYPSLPKPPPWIYPFVPHPETTPSSEPTEDDWQKLIDGIKEVQEFDEKTNQPHCEDPSKGHVVDGLIDKVSAQIKAAIDENKIQDAKGLTEILTELLRIRKELC